jgi:hypothetical protein
MLTDTISNIVNKIGKCMNTAIFKQTTYTSGIALLLATVALVRIQTPLKKSVIDLIAREWPPISWYLAI